ncbi:SCO3870 family protein [Streptomyces decoyicus]|uniref:SCO3870 family protein n=1 Tax=Streptomyces decoyicus TaxID=249567 RepID=A0ABZ1FB05_9ACTN|nr:SCO3870 family protein [Streptomyces decoyicus]WSB67531.1 SCO3870 family protein [Streptomyces decoyicus]
MTQPPFATLSTALAALGIALGAFAVQLRADGYEQYVESVATASVVMLTTAGLTVVTWVRHRRQLNSD